MPKPLLCLRNLGKSFAAVRALQDVTFDLLSGEVHALVGENGAGKSTLVHIITGAQRPDAGIIEINGSRMDHLTTALARELGITCVYQHPALFPDLSVAENMALRLERFAPLNRIRWKAHQARAEQLLQRIGAAIDPSTLARQLSMPQQQLVEIGCALGTNARIIVMDEPTACLTQREQQLLFGLVRELRAQGAGIIYVSHRLDEIFALADRLTILRDGQRVLTSPVNELNESSLIRHMVGRELSSELIGSEPKSREETQKRNQHHPVLALRHVTCAAAGIRDISFDLQAGEIFGLAGLVGAGRTELARTLFGITPAESGQILIEGKAVEMNSPQSAVKAGIAYVPEDRHSHGVILDFPVEQNISLASHGKVFPRGWLNPQGERYLASEFIRALDIKPATPDVVTTSLSGGNQQKVALARWLATKPKVLILDEPTQGVDVGAKWEIHRLIREQAGQGLAVLLISSDLPELLALSDQVGVMRQGALVALMPGKSDPHQVMAAAFGQCVNAP